MPLELLTAIFSFCRYPIRPKDSGYKLWWKSLILVCRLWHDVIVSAPTLWTEIIFDRFKLTELMLSRSRRASISICFDFDRKFRGVSRCSKAVSLALQDHLDHTAEIDLSGPMFNMLNIVDLLRRPAPRLGTLRLVGHGSERRPLSTYGDELFKADLLGDTAPQLRTLYLSGICIPLESPILSSPNLIHLSLVEICVSANFSAEQLVHALGTLCRLEYLSIGFSTEGPPRLPGTTIYPPPLPNEPIVLPVLTDLTFRATARFTATVMQNIAIPPETNVSLDMLPSKVARPFLPRYIGYDSTSTPWSTLYVKQFPSHLEIAAHAEYSFDVFTRRNRNLVQSTPQAPDDRTRRLLITAHDVDIDRLQYTILAQMFGCMPLGDVRALILHAQTDMDVDGLRSDAVGQWKVNRSLSYTVPQWRSILSPFKSVVSLDLWRHRRSTLRDIVLAMEPFDPFLDAHVDPMALQEQRPRLMSSLKHLAVHTHDRSGLGMGGRVGTSKVNASPITNIFVWWRSTLDEDLRLELEDYIVDGEVIDEEDLDGWMEQREKANDLIWKVLM